MAADSSNSTSSNAANIESVLSAVQNWVAAQNGLTKSLSAIISSNHVNLNLSNLTTLVSTTTGTVTTINTSIGLTGGPISTSGTLAVSLTTLTNSISSDHALTNIANYFDGPTVAQGSSGTWFASGTVTVQDTAGAARIDAKLWDGTTVMASGDSNTTGATGNAIIALSGFITSPAGNIRISCKDLTSVSGKIIFNFTGNSKDSTITAVRIA